MDKSRIQGPTRLQGEVTISGARNTALSILSVALLAERPVEIRNAPRLEDADTLMKLLNQLGTEVECNGSVHTDARDVNIFYAPYDLVKIMHVSIWVLGPLVARFGQRQVSLLGGCAIGARPVDLHISSLEQLGATVKLEGGYVKTSIDGRLKGAYTMMDKVSVGVTATIICVTILAENTTIIENAMHEPGIVDTTNSLIMLGAKISSQGIDCIAIEDAERLGGSVYCVLPDHIETGTFLVAVVISRGKIICCNTQLGTPGAILTKLRDAGADIGIDEDWIGLGTYGECSKTANVRTAPYPAFPINMQAQSTLSNLVAEGIGFTTETVFENRFMYMPELSRMGTHAEIESNIVICHDVEKFSGAQIMATDLCVSANLVLAGCIAEEMMAADHIYHINRGYERTEDKLHALDTNIEHMRGE